MYMESYTLTNFLVTVLSSLLFSYPLPPPSPPHSFNLNTLQPPHTLCLDPSPGTPAQAHRLALATVLFRELTIAQTREHLFGQHIQTLDGIRGLVQRQAWKV